MKYFIITFRSVTPAQRAENALRRAGCDCSIRRTPKWMEEQGCGYSLQIRSTDAPRCAQLLQDGQIPYRKIYLRRENGSMEEVTL